MLSLHSGLRYEFYLPPCDMRKGFNGLCGLVQNQLGRSPDTGEVFIFMSRDRTRLKLLRWEPGGFVLYYKQLEQGTFALPRVSGTTAVITYPELVLLVEGLKMETKVEKKRWKR